MATKRKTAKLLAYLQTALELELSTIPPYLTALLSIHPQANREAANMIRGIMVEEMLHMALVANVLNAVGGAPRIDKETIPSYPLELEFDGKKFRDRDFPVDLAAFSKEQIATFMKIEEPEDLVQPRALEFKRIVVRGLTIGQFYMNIIAMLEELDEDGDLFTGDPSRQLIDNYYWGAANHIIPVSDLKSAKRALDIVIRQGEGAWRQPGKRIAFAPGEPAVMGHYYRFAEIYYERHYTDTDDPAKPPTGAPLPVDWSAVYPIKTNPKPANYPKGSKLAELNGTFNARYTEMLRQLNQALNGTPKTLYTAIMNGMHTLPPYAIEMMQTPIKGGGKTTGCPTFSWVKGP